MLLCQWNYVFWIDIFGLWKYLWEVARPHYVTVVLAAWIFVLDPLNIRFRGRIRYSILVYLKLKVVCEYYFCDYHLCLRWHVHDRRFRNALWRFSYLRTKLWVSHHLLVRRISIFETYIVFVWAVRNWSISYNWKDRAWSHFYSRRLIFTRKQNSRLFILVYCIKCKDIMCRWWFMTIFLIVKLYEQFESTQWRENNFIHGPSSK